MTTIETTRYTQDSTTYICAGDRSTDEDVARAAAEAALRAGETLADDMDRVDGCCTWTIERMEWVVGGKGEDRDFGRVEGNEVTWLRQEGCRTPVCEGLEWFATREEAERAAGDFDRLVAAIESAGETVTGGENAADVAQEWIDAGLTAEQAAAYIAAGCWVAERVAELVRAGITAIDIADEDVLRAVAASREFAARERGRPSSGCGDDLDIAEWVTDASLSYAHSNRDLSTAEIAAAIAEVRS